MDWYDIARTTNWSPIYVTESELFRRRWVAISASRWKNGNRMTNPTSRPIRSTWRSSAKRSRQRSNAARFSRTPTRAGCLMKAHYGV